MCEGLVMYNREFLILSTTYLIGAPSYCPDVEGDAMGLLFRPHYIHIVRYQEFPGPCHCGPPLSVELRGAEIWSPLRVLQLWEQSMSVYVNKKMRKVHGKTGA